MNSRDFAWTGLLLLLLAAHGAGAAVPARAQGGDELIELTMQLLGDADKDMRALGLEQIRTGVPGSAATEKFAGQLPQLPAEVQVELIRALTDRRDAAARPAIVALLKSSENEAVRLAAVRSLGFLGQAADLDLLVEKLTAGTAAEQAAARESLGRLPDEALSPEIARRVSAGAAPLRRELLQVLVARRAFDQAEMLLPVAVDPDPEVRAAAMTALSQLAGPAQIPGMLQGILAAEPGRAREAAEKAVMMACQRMEDPAGPAAPLLSALHALGPEEQLVLLPAVGRVGGPQALVEVKKALSSSDPRRHEAGLRALCNWPDASVAPELRELARTDRHSGHARMALRALIRIAPLPDGRSEEEKLQLLKDTLPLCQQGDERTLVLERAGAIRSPETLRFLLPFVDQAEFTETACWSIVELAHHRTLREPHKAEFDAALEKVKQTSQDATTIDRANRYQRGETWVRPKTK